MKKIIRKVSFIILGLVLVVVSGYLLIFGQDMFAIMDTTDQYMKAMNNGDAETAYNLVATRSKAITSIDLYKLALQNEQFRYPYVGYKKMCVRWIQFEPSMPPYIPAEIQSPPFSRTASITSCLHYEDQTKVGSMIVYLEKENGYWRVFSINIGAYTP